jgi:WhiB family redox-sensing transcriptional regulator
MPFHVTHPEWHRRRSAECNRTNVRLFFPAKGASAEPAKAICADCPVVQQCAAWALSDHGLDGVLGGMTAGGRDRHRQRQAA